MADSLEMTTLGGGCFWCVEAVYQELQGVQSVVSGYAGGAVENPTYYQVCNGTTGHAEVVQITFDPKIIMFEDILYVFWRTHDPTTLNRQGYDVGTQYRSIILYHSEQQRTIAEKSKHDTDASGLWPNPIVTEISPFTTIYKAEDYHQNFYRDNPYQPYCLAIIDPKMTKLRKELGAKLKDASHR
ncbi:MAG TPA: peptide-methionine (S)-S-oxide reductase MsrA [Candidatus Saccharimonadia bacterium]|jgi:peptide-methionine (S)-S-oxide reductase|nr:peptide-methionine (S)-S-oxide reductase MsrA [Candidatus Saccharimonadia bacterium]